MWRKTSKGEGFGDEIRKVYVEHTSLTVLERNMGILDFALMRSHWTVMSKGVM